MKESSEKENSGNVEISQVRMLTAKPGERDSLNAQPFRINVWQAAVLFQVFAVIILTMSEIWSALVVYAPKMISQYLPYEYPQNLPAILEVLPLVAVAAVIAYFSFKGSRKALLASLIFNVLALALTLPAYTFASYNTEFYGSSFNTISLPSLGTLLLFVVWVIIMGLDVSAYRSSRSAK